MNSGCTITGDLSTVSVGAPSSRRAVPVIRFTAEDLEEVLFVGGDIADTVFESGI